MFKVCTGCKVKKQFEEYGKDKKGKFGLNQKCKECCRKRDKSKYRSKESIEKHKKYKAEWQRKNRDLLNTRLRDRYEKNIEKSREEARKRAVKCRKSKKYKEKKNDYDREYRKEYPEKVQARDKVKYAVSTGELIRSSQCELCKKVCHTHGHHQDYSKPLDIIWLCPTCHISHHRNHKNCAERLSEKTPLGDAKV